MKKYFLFLVLFILLFLGFPKQTFATVLFSDNFDNINFLDRWVIFNGMPACSNWEIKDGMLGNSINNQYSCTTNIIPNDLSWPILSKNYIFEVDARFVRGTDHNLIVIVNPSTSSGFELHFQSPGDFVINLPTGSVYNLFIPGNYPNGATYRIKSIINNKNLQIYINDLLVRDITLPNEPEPGKIGLRAGTGADPNSETWFDNIVVTSLDPNPPSTDLNVPLIKQTSDPWQSQIYDSANIWSPLKPTINDWGCVLTSAAMILKYYGINKLPDGTTLNPGSLNAWLKTQKDGYVRDGWVNWLAISRLSKLAKAVNGITSFDALEYLRRHGEDKPLLTSDIISLQPDILEEPGHFIVAKGINGDTFDINDPAYNRSTLNDGYSNTFLSLGRYIPSNTNLSYIMLAIDQNIQIVLKDSLGNSVGEQFIQQPLVNDSNPSQTNGQPIKFLYFKKPPSGNYQLEISSPNIQEYTINTYLYDINGGVNTGSQTGIAGPDGTNTFLLSFDQNNSNNSNAKKIVTFQTIIDDINHARNLNLITKKELYKELLEIIKHAKKNAEKGKNKKVIKNLNKFEKVLNKKFGRGIAETAYKILIYDVNYLQNYYQTLISPLEKDEDDGEE